MIKINNIQDLNDRIKKLTHDIKDQDISIEPYKTLNDELTFHKSYEGKILSQSFGEFLNAMCPLEKYTKY